MPREKRLITIVYPDEQVQLFCKRILERQGFDVKCFSASAQVQQLIQTWKPDLVLTGIRLSEKDGFEVLQTSRSIDPLLPVIAMTTHASIPAAIRFLKAGGANYLAIPFSADQLREAVTETLAAVCSTNSLEPDDLGTAFKPLDSIVGNSRCVLDLKRILTKVAGSNINVLIRGETGTGKELVAQALHELSGRASGPFLPVDCASLPPTLLESELFGYQRGAFTGADKSRCGLFEAANGGTMFLDEIGELDTSTQSSLFRVLQEGKIRHIGGRRDTPINVRVLAATNRNLEQGIKEGTFRAELYFRLKVVTISLPPLRERREDIPLLAAHFFGIFRKNHARQDLTGMDSSFMSALLDYPWPGNVRELKNLIEEAVVLSDGPALTRSDVPQDLNQIEAPDEADFGDQRQMTEYAQARNLILDSFDRKYFQRLLALYGGNLSEAARRSGLGRKTIYNRLRRIGILPVNFSARE
jgi:DNA-binding NtrC family response regulator